jgi:hypothetical protein
MARAFVDLLCRGGVPAFEFGGLDKDPSQEDDARPDLTIRDTDGAHRVSVETTFWRDVDAAQPAAYLKQLPAGTPGALVFIAPWARTRDLWRDLKERCEDSGELEIGDESRAADATWAQVGPHVLSVRSWTSVLDTLQRAAGDPAVEQDVLQLRGLTERMDKEAFPPLTEDEVGNSGLARRIKGYQQLLDRITDRLSELGLVRLGNRSYRAGSYRTGRGTGRSMQLDGKLDLRFGIELTPWRDSGLTPLWWVLKSSPAYSIEKDWLRIMKRIEDVRSYQDSLYIPIRLKTGVAEADVIANAVEQMRRIAAAYGWPASSRTMLAGWCSRAGAACSRRCSTPRPRAVRPPSNRTSCSFAG